MSGGMSNKFHHVGYAVQDISASEEAFTALGVEFYRRTIDRERNLEFSFGVIGEI